MKFARAERARERLNQKAAGLVDDYGKWYLESEAACVAILKNECPQKFSRFVERYIVIGTVTAIEVYFRDLVRFMLEFTNKNNSALINFIHQEKYSASDLLEMQSMDIDPIDVIVSSMSFQNTYQIGRVFSKLIDNDFWNAVTVSLDHLKPKGQPWPDNKISSLESLFDLRHQLVHEGEAGEIVTEEFLVTLTRIHFITRAAGAVVFDNISKTWEDNFNQLAREEKKEKLNYRHRK